MLKAKLYHKYTHVRKKCLILFAFETMIMHVFFPCLYMLYELNFWQSILVIGLWKSFSNESTFRHEQEVNTEGQGIVMVVSCN